MATNTVINYKLHHEDALPPLKYHVGDAGWDVHCIHDFLLPKWEKAKLETGLQIEIPEGYYCQIAARSGLSIKYNTMVMAGVIDRSYQGTLSVVLYNASNSHLYFKKHTRIAQLLFIKIAEPVTLLPVEQIQSNSTRHANGFGDGTGLF